MNISKNKREKLEKFISDWMNEMKVPGLSLSVVENQDIIYANGFGSRDLKNNLPATIDTLYGIGSCTKSFTGLAILNLVSDRRLDLDDDIEEYLPIEWEKNITVHELLTHSSGMPSLGVAEALIDRLIEMDERGTPLGGWDDFFTHLNGARDEITDRSEDIFFYFNSGYELLGLIIEEITGIDYSEYIQKNILEPLEMDDSTFEYKDSEEYMTPYFIRENKPERTPYPDEEIGYASGGLLSSAVELANYVMMNMNDGEFKGKQIIDEDFLEKAHTGYIDSEIGKYGYGWAVNDFLGEKLIGHGGSIGVASGYIGFMDDVGVALVANTSPSFSMEEIGKAVLAIMKDEEAKELPFFIRKNRMDMLTGDYESYRGIKKAGIEKEYGLLKLTFKERLESQKLILIPESKKIDDFRFYYLDGNGQKNTVRFDIGENGDIDLYIGRWRLHKI